MTLTIRQATPADAAIVAEFNTCLAIETESKTLDGVLLRKGVDALLADPSKGIYFLAESEGKVVGQTMITYEWSDWRNGTFWWIQSVYVAKEARSAGVFKALFHHIEALAKARPDICGLRLYVDEHNSRARQTYEHLGMKSSHYRLYEMDFVL